MKLNSILLLFLSGIPYLLTAQDQASTETYQKAEGQLGFNTSQSGAVAICPAA